MEEDRGRIEGRWKEREMKGTREVERERQEREARREGGAGGGGMER